MRRFPTPVKTEFVYQMEVGGLFVTEIECRACATVRPGEPCRPWQDDPGSGPEVESFTDLEVLTEDGYRPIGGHWLYPHILAHLESGAEDERFAKAVDSFGPDPDSLRELRAG